MEYNKYKYDITNNKIFKEITTFSNNYSLYVFYRYVGTNIIKGIFLKKQFYKINNIKYTKPIHIICNLSKL